MSQRLEFWIPLTPGADAASPARSWSWAACVTQPLVPLSKPGEEQQERFHESHSLSSKDGAGQLGQPPPLFKYYGEDKLGRRARHPTEEARTAEESSTPAARNGRSRSRYVSKVGISRASIDAGSVEIPSRA